MLKYEAKWSGGYPCLCSGEWKLYINGELSEVEIPFQGEPADTYGTYPSWHFDENWCEVFEDYEEGLNVDAWCEEYKDYLDLIAPVSDWPLVYEAFSSEDWRHGSCGGCI